MRISTIFAMATVLLLSGCAHAPVMLPPEEAETMSTLEGTAVEQHWKMPDGRPGKSNALRLKQPVLFGEKIYHVVELKLDERWHVGWDDYAGRHLRVHCVVGKSTMWGYPHLWCSPRHVERVQ